MLPGGHDDLESFLRSTETTAFIVVKRDRLLYEHYFNGYQHGSTQTSFSVAKSFASALVGIAVDDGTISLNDAMTDYISELKERDARFERITLSGTSSRCHRASATKSTERPGATTPRAITLPTSAS